jgi:hypothetical protein
VYRSLFAISAALVALGAPAQAKEKPFVSKIGIHLLVKYTDGAKKIIQANCPIIKILDCHPDMMAALRDYKTAHPKGIVVLRIYTNNRYDITADPAASAKDYWDTRLWPQLSQLTEQQKKWIDYLEGPNEYDTCPAWGTVADVEWFCKFWLALAPIMYEHGFKPCLASISVGNPSGPPEEVEAKIKAFIPALRLAKKLGGSWSYHPYTIKYTKDPSVEIHYSLRYRRFYDILAKHAPDLKDLPIVFTEGGVDSDGTHGNKPGWKRDTPEKFKDWLAWFDSEIKKDSYVKGCTLFQIGHPEGWDSFDLEPLADWLAGYLGK